MLNTFFQRPDAIETPLFVVATLFNPVRYRARWKLYQDFARRIEAAGAVLYTVEVALGERSFAITDANNPRHVQVRTRDPIWLKENAINLGVQRLPADWKYVAWIDADIAFARDDWADETKHQLQHWPVIQMWSEAHDLSDGHELLNVHRSLAWCWNEGEWPEKPNDPSYRYDAGGNGPGPGPGPGRRRGQLIYRHPGYAWAMRREAFEALGGLIDFSILGAADWHMAYAMVGEIDRTISREYHPGFQNALRRWGERAARVIDKNLGVMPGAIFHYWHGSAPNRRYRTRWRIFVENQFDPDRDIFRDSQGLFQIAPHAQALKRSIHRYLSERDEDSTHYPGPHFPATREGER